MFYLIQTTSESSDCTCEYEVKLDKEYTVGDQPTIKYDFSNIEEVILEFIDMWRKNDRPDSVRKYQEFLSWGEKYGWD